jgi:hypothetical protein
MPRYPVRKLILMVRADRWVELSTALAMIDTTTSHPLPHERVVDLGLKAIAVQHRRRKYQREWRRKKRGQRERAE